MNIKIKKIINKKTIIFILVLLSLGIFFGTRQEKPKILKITPQDGAENVLDNTEIVITFNKELEPKDKTKITIEITPEEVLQVTWSEKQMRISPLKVLNPETNYSIIVKFKNEKIYTFSFKTSPISTEQLRQEGDILLQDYLLFDKAFRGFIETHPWYTSLPIENIQYRIVYDFEEKSFRIRIKVSVSEEEEKVLVEKALENLKQVGVTEPIPYYVLKGE